MLALKLMEHHVTNVTVGELSFFLTVASLNSKGWGGQTRESGGRKSPSGVQRRSPGGV